MRHLISLGLAVGLFGTALTATAPAIAGPMKFCIETTGKDTRYFQAEGPGKPHRALAPVCQGDAVMTFVDASQRSNATPRIDTPIYILTHQKKYWVVSKRKVQDTKKRWFEFETALSGSGYNEWNQFLLKPADPKIKKGTPLAAGMTFHVVPKKPHKRFKVLTAMKLKDWGGVVIASQAFYKAPGTTFRLAKAGAKTAVASPAQAGKPQWGIYGGPWAPPRLHKDGNLVILTGLVKGKWDEHVWTIPKNMAPAQRLIFNTNNHDRSARVDVWPDGKVTFVAGGRYQDWLSLAGIQYNLKTIQKASLKSGWQPYGGPFAPPAFAKQGTIVSVQGLAKGNAKVLFQLPNGYRPRGRMIFNMNNHEASYRLDIHTNGNIEWTAGGKKHGWLSLSGITFDLNAGKPLALAKGWANYGRGYAGAAASKTGKTVIVRGLVKHGKFANHIATLPAGMRPPQILVFSANNHEGQARLNVHPNGQIHYAGGQKKHGWLNLTGITFAVK